MDVQENKPQTTWLQQNSAMPKHSYKATNQPTEVLEVHKIDVAAQNKQ